MSARAIRAGFPMLLALTACASAPIHYYTLVPQEAHPLQAGPTAIDVRIARLPPQLNRPELVVRSGGNELVVLEDRRWASSLRDEIREAVRLDPIFDASSSMHKLEVVIYVDRLDAELDHAVVFDGKWRVRTQGSSSPLNTTSAACSLHAVKTVGAGYAAMVDGYQDAMHSLSQAIFASLASRTCLDQ